MKLHTFHFKHFSIQQANSALKVGTDAMVLGAIVPELKHIENILDIGSGTGVLSLMMAQKFPDVTITAVECDPESAKDNVLNFENSKWAPNLNLVVGDILTVPFQEKFELIISNPPFYHNSLVNEDLKKAKARHSVHLPFELLISRIKELLSANGTCWMIVPFESFMHVSNLLMNEGLFILTLTKIYAKTDQLKRIVFSFGFKENAIEENALVIRNNDNSYSAQYIELTKDFHSVDLSQKA